MASPDFFDIIDVKNAHMKGQMGKLDRQKAKSQWNNLKKVYEEWKSSGALEEISVIPGAEACEDMVFAANQSFPWITGGGEKIVIMSKMKHPSRQREVPFFEKFYKESGYKLIHLSNAEFFEGMGDTIPHPGRNLLYGGFGHRTDPSAHEELSEILNVPVIGLELVNEKFYHLDTCFVPLDEETVMICSEAFNDQGLKMIRVLFKDVIDIPLKEAAGGFALNAHLLNDKLSGRKFAVLQKGNDTTVSMLKKAGYAVWEIDTSEFIKSGGSVFCMKVMYY